MERFQERIKGLSLAGVLRVFRRYLEFCNAMNFRSKVQVTGCWKVVTGGISSSVYFKIQP